MRDAINYGTGDIKTVSLIITYTLSKALAISPLEIMKMPATMVMDLLALHKIVEDIKAKEMQKQSDKMK
tara:strand:+ start:3719 stop:3925 length:207 start_codon:yes stop_codon:yes gene_type:complete